ncbi:hypothetical protein Tco_1010770 [Tanacetum coccineum]
MVYKEVVSANAKRRTTWFDLLLKSNIYQNEDHILGPSTVAIAKKLNEIIQKDELTIAYLEGAGLEKLKLHYKNDWNSDEGDVSKPRSFECHMSKSLKPHPSFYKNDFITGHTLALKRSTLHISPSTMLQEDSRQDFFKAEINNRTPGNVYSDKKIIAVVRVVLGVESYQRTINLTKPKIYFEGIDEKIPYIMTGTEKGVVYLNKYNRRSLMKLNEVHKFCDGTLMKIQENLIDMVNKNELGRGNERLRGRDWNDKDVKRSKEMVDKIDQVMKRREQLRRLEEYVGGRPKTIDPRSFVRPM